MTDTHQAASEASSPTFPKVLRAASLVEGCSTLILFFIAMPLKYIWKVDHAVSWPGRIHGGLFVLLVVLAIIAIRKVPITPRFSLTIVGAAIIPFGPFFIDKKIKALYDSPVAS